DEERGNEDGHDEWDWWLRDFKGWRKGRVATSNLGFLRDEGEEKWSKKEDVIKELGALNK
ncbi:unnamed protein product, partial [Dovyalis caffra]